jgi:hypothetical protein
MSQLESAGVHQIGDRTYNWEDASVDSTPESIARVREFSLEFSRKLDSFIIKTEKMLEEL